MPRVRVGAAVLVAVFMSLGAGQALGATAPARAHVTAPRTIVPVRGIASAGASTCALLSTGGVMCWGDDSANELGSGGAIVPACVGTTSCSDEPVPVIGIAHATSISGGNGLLYCATIAGGTAACWGENSSGELGSGSVATAPSTAVAVRNLTGVTQVSAGWAQACALLSTHRVECWGDDTSDELGTGSPQTCALPGDLQAHCSLTPVGVKGITTATQIAAGSGFGCALLAAGTVSCWGEDDEGELGVSPATLPTCVAANTACAPVPVTVPGLSGVTAISASTTGVCALVTGGTVWCWGSNAEGELGTGSSTGPQTCHLAGGTTPSCSWTPLEVPGLSSIRSVSVGWIHTCAVDSTGGAHCWGGDYGGDLGDGGGEPVTTCEQFTYLYPSCVQGPVAVQHLGAVAQVTSGKFHSCALTAAGNVSCWGDTTVGEIGSSASSPYSPQYSPRAPDLALEPSSPVAVKVVVSTGAATVTWTKPASSGGSALAQYEVVAAPLGMGCLSSKGPCQFHGLGARSPYTFSVAASNAVGFGAATVSAVMYLVKPGPLTAFSYPASTTLAVPVSIVVVGAKAGLLASVTYAKQTRSCRLDAQAQCWVSVTPTKPGPSTAAVKVGATVRKVTFVTYL